MQRVRRATAVAVLPADPVGGTPGFFPLPNPGGGIPAAIPGYEWYNNIQEEVAAPIEAMGMTLDGTVRNQLYLAIQAMINRGSLKMPVRVASTAAINLAAPGANIDGVAMVAGDRFLEKDHGTPSSRGLYIWNGAAVAATRATDADGVGEMVAGMLVVVQEGTVNADSLWALTTNGTITIGTTGLTFAREDGSNITTSKIQPVTASVAANALTLTLNPTTLDFRSATLGSGTVNTRTIGSAISVVVPSTATLGAVNAQQSRLALLAIDNAGTIEAAVVNIAGGNNLDESTLISTTAISVGATSNNVIYSTTARASVPFRVVGYVESTQATAGTWATAPSTIQGAGGQALTSMGSLGFGQTWQSVTRTSGTTYYNTTGKPITLNMATAYTQSLNGQTTVACNGGAAVVVCYNSNTTVSGTDAGSIVIPAGASYVVTDTNATGRTSWELR